MEKGTLRRVIITEKKTPGPLVANDSMECEACYLNTKPKIA